MQDFLPVTREDMKSRGWDELDFVYVTGDAYVDHPSFIRFPKSTEAQMPILREEKWD